MFPACEKSFLFRHTLVLPKIVHSYSSRSSVGQSIPILAPVSGQHRYKLGNKALSSPDCRWKKQRSDDWNAIASDTRLSSSSVNPKLPSIHWIFSLFRWATSDWRLFESLHNFDRIMLLITGRMSRNYRNLNPNILLAHGPYFHEPSHTPDRKGIYCFQLSWQTWRPLPAAFFWHGDRSGSFRRSSPCFGLYLLSKALPWIPLKWILPLMKNICTPKIAICQRKAFPNDTFG